MKGWSFDSIVTFLTVNIQKKLSFCHLKNSLDLFIAAAELDVSFPGSDLITVAGFILHADI